MDWARILAYITGSVDQELLSRNDYLAAENRILRAQIKNRLLLTDAEKATPSEIAHRLGRNALEDVANAAKPNTILGWYGKLVARKSDGSKSVRRTSAILLSGDRMSFFDHTGFSLNQIMIKVHFWSCELDRSALPAMGRYLRNTIPNSEATFVPDAGHLWILVHLKDVLDIVKRTAVAVK